MLEAIAWIVGIFLFLLVAASVKAARGPADDAGSTKGKKAKERPLIIPKRGLKIPAQIVYSGGSDPGGRRDILINSVENVLNVETQIYNKIVSAFCMTARETRHFRVDRITELIDGETGEVVPDAGQWIVKTIADRQREKRAENATRARQRRQDARQPKPP